MDIKSKDPLLTAATVLVVLSQIVMIFGMVMLGIGIGALLTVGRTGLLAEIALSGAPPVAFWLVILAMLTGIVLLGLAWRFLNELRGIIKTVDAGDPFRHDNADRLNRMGWIAIIGQVIVMPVAALALWSAPYLDKVERELHIDGAFDWTTILLALVLFILARVFRHGADMRADLEGTV